MRPKGKRRGVEDRSVVKQGEKELKSTERDRVERKDLLKKLECSPTFLNKQVVLILKTMSLSSRSTFPKTSREASKNSTSTSQAKRK